MTDTFLVTASGKPTITKDPNAVLDYSWDWSDWLAEISPTSAIASHAIITDGVTKDSSSSDGAIVTAIISGGTVGQTASATCRITTDDTPPRIEDRTLYFKIKER